MWDYNISYCIKSRALKKCNLRVSEQGLASTPTQYRLSRRQFYRSKDPTNIIIILKEDKNKHKKHIKHNKNTHIQKKKIP